MHGAWIDKHKILLFKKAGHRFEEIFRVEISSAEGGFLGAGASFPGFEKAARALRHSRSILLFGPGMMKHHFRNYLMENYPSTARKVAACEQLDPLMEDEVPYLLEAWESKAP